mmetsp:Transcript_2176/g.2982  ORF Transcript_2176/g.2982 Transcript_2176/m.2982 type:complete len:134 (-) Transcript_2176:215-616(-)
MNVLLVFTLLIIIVMVVESRRPTRFGETPSNMRLKKISKVKYFYDGQEVANPYSEPKAVNEHSESEGALSEERNLLDDQEPFEAPLLDDPVHWTPLLPVIMLASLSSFTLLLWIQKKTFGSASEGTIQHHAVV